MNVFKIKQWTNEENFYNDYEVCKYNTAWIHLKDHVFLVNEDELIGNGIKCFTEIPKVIYYTEDPYRYEILEFPNEKNNKLFQQIKKLSKL